ncbi:hypothetical protein GE061_015841 [Apolygus lucorum]|uniref:Major facilitator superfamily (MFS) profile domain-containing protein n=1 Tax=Apolygus lucorum TaxID=248454 RepID=A0A6A4JBR3_APOLU|nr:hypothetical protein GE061_015841 [Apolygus lucorum]
MFHNSFSVGPYGQWVVAIMATICSLTSGQFYAWPAAALPQILDGSAGFSLSDNESAWMITITFLGNILSPIPSGALMDRIGRRNTLSLGILVAITSWLILAFLTDIVSIFIARFLSGVWGGIVYTVVPAFLGEVVDPKIRGSMGAVFGVMLYVGALYESLASNVTYQLFIFISMIPPVILFVGFLFIPESPYYYLRKQKREKAKNSIIWLKGSCSDEDLDNLQQKVQQQLETKGTFCDIFRTKAGRKAFIIVEVLQAVQRCAGVTFLFAYTTVVVPTSWLSPQNSFLLLTVVWIVCSLLSSTIMDKFGRKTLLSISCLGSGLAMCSAAVWYYLREFSTIDTSTTNYMPLLFLIISGIFYSMGIVSIPTIVQSELFPVNVKSKGSALACITANIFSGISTRFFFDINNAIGVYFNFVIMGVSPLICVVFILTVMVETKGKSLEMIQDMLNGHKVVTPIVVT